MLVYSITDTTVCCAITISDHKEREGEEES